MSHLYEHFGCKENLRKLVNNLRSVGFTAIPGTGGNHSWFKAESAKIRPIPTELSTLALEWGGDRDGVFEVVLDRCLESYSNVHPIRRFMEKLEGLIPYGNGDGGSQYPIRDYLVN
jgi:hypothetical protein